jgi:hypothetical protein
MMEKQEEQRHRAVLENWDRAQEEVRRHEFPELLVQREGDDPLLLCPYCGEIIGDDLFSVDSSERWNPVETISFDEGRVTFGTGDDDYDATLYYRHGRCEGPVALPQGWKEGWLW